MIRSGKIDMAILGGLEVSAQGDLANWLVPGKKVPGIGGAIELAQKAKRIMKGLSPHIQSQNIMSQEELMLILMNFTLLRRDQKIQREYGSYYLTRERV